MKNTYKTDTYAKGEPGEKKKTSRPILSERIGHFPQRLETAIGGVSLRSFSRTCGLSEAVLRNYLKGDTFPTLDRLDQLAAAGNVEAAWLATGEGPMRPGEQVSAQSAAADQGNIKASIDSLLLAAAIETVEEGLAETERNMSPKKKAQLILSVYDLFSEEASIGQEKGKILRLLKSIA